MTACIHTYKEDNKKKQRRGEMQTGRRIEKEWEENLRDYANTGDLQL